MPLSLKPVPAARGAAWVGDAFRLFGRRPFAFSGLFLSFLFIALVAMFVPYVGGVLQMMLLPLLSLGFMLASVSALQGGPVQPGQFFAPLAGEPARRRSLLLLCAAYGLGAMALLWFSDWLSDGQLTELRRALGSGQAADDEVNALAASRGVFAGTLSLLVGGALLSVPFWHAPALVHWGGHGVAQALFSSTVAVWRAKGAFLVYALCWSGLVIVFGLFSTVLLSLLGAPQMAPTMALPAGLVFSTVFYVSLLFTFNDSFGNGTAAAPAQA